MENYLYSMIRIGCVEAEYDTVEIRVSSGVPQGRLISNDAEFLLSITARQAKGVMSYMTHWPDVLGC